MNANRLGAHEDPETASSKALCAADKAMVTVLGGCFDMGSGNAGEFELPVHGVAISPFRLDATPVTNREFAAFVDTTSFQTDAQACGSAWGYKDGQYQRINGLTWRSYAAGRDEHPVVLISWYDAQAFACWAGKRLPTEAEWEYAARGGLAGAQYPWGDAEPDVHSCGFARTPGDVPGTSPVGSFAANGFGLRDMVGNVWQWCADWYAPAYYANSATLDPAGPAQGTLKVRRGGAWNVIQPFRLRNSNRGAVRPDTAVPNMGFRCAMDL